MKEFTGHFARDGFFALALDLFGGRTAKDDAARADLRNEAEQHRWLQRFALQPVRGSRWGSELNPSDIKILSPR